MFNLLFQKNKASGLKTDLLAKNLILIFFFLFSTPYFLLADQLKNGSYRLSLGSDSPTADTISSQRFFIQPEYKTLRSTHKDRFNGANVVLNYKANSLLLIGLGSEYSYNRKHDDNGWKLSSLRFLPLFVDAKLSLYKNSKFSPYLQLSEGVSINNYSKKDTPLKNAHHVNERGDYLYTGIGCGFPICKYLDPIVSLGFNGFHMSFNNMDVNPHGLTLRMGFMI